MTERSSSHKSDGRQSSTGHSAHSTRLNSLGLDSRPPALEPALCNPAPGLLILDPLPSIIRCWLDKKFSNESLLYAVVCTGSSSSSLSSNLAARLGITPSHESQSRDYKAKLQVYLPEATIQHSSTRSSSSTPHLPSFSADFTVRDSQDRADRLQIFLGSDLLRARSADISFSKNRITLLDDDRNTVTVPLVRPENSASYKDLITGHCLNGPSNVALLETHARDDSNAPLGVVDDRGSRPESNATALKINPGAGAVHPGNGGIDSSSVTSSKLSSALEELRVNVPLSKQSSPTAETGMNNRGSENSPSVKASDVLSKDEQGGKWSSWRRTSTSTQNPESSFSSVATSSGYQRPGRGKGMKVLRPSKSTSLRVGPTVNHQTQVSPLASSEQVTRVGDGDSADSLPLESRGRSFSSEAKAQITPTGGKSRSSNPVGGASAFGWLNNTQPKSPVP